MRKRRTGSVRTKTQPASSGDEAADAVAALLSGDSSEEVVAALRFSPLPSSGEPDEFGKLGFGVFGPDAPWTEAALDAVVQHLTTKFIVPLDALQLDLDDPWRAVDVGVIASAWKKNKNCAISLRAPVESGFAVHLSYRQRVSVWVEPDAWRRYGRDTLIGMARAIAEAMPGFEYADATAVGQLGELWSARDWPWLPLSFRTELYWWQALHPTRFERDYTRDVLLATPAVDVDSWPDGTLSLQVFDDPFDWRAPTSLKRLEDCVRYLAGSKRT